MLIEFIGLPGSGKTTYLQSKFEKNILTREEIKNRKIPMKTRFSFYFQEWKIVMLFVLGLLYNFEFKLKKWYALVLGVTATLKQYSLVYHYIKKQPNRSIILDEGLLQRSLSICSYNDRKYNVQLLKILVKKINNLNIIDLVYSFEITIEESKNRCKKRKSGLPFRFQNLNVSELNNKLNNFQKGILILKKYMKPELRIIK
jgi:hypothetical protein